MNKSEEWPGGSTTEELIEYFKINPGDKVLDAGCGTLPFPLATHLCDITMGTNPAGRIGSDPVPFNKLGKPFYECSIDKMPFEDKEFDFVYCAHVLEHLNDPQAACQEIIRVGKRGYIECPSSWHEIVFPAGDHKWLVDHERNCLIFREKLDEERQDILGLQYPFIEISKDIDFLEYWKYRYVRKVRNVEFYWENKLDCIIIPIKERKNAKSFSWFYSRPDTQRDKQKIANFIKDTSREMLKTIKKRVC